MKLPILKPREVIAALLRAGFVEYKKGASTSHRYFYHPVLGHTTQVPVHKGRDIKPGTLRAIIRQAGLTVQEFLRLL